MKYILVTGGAGFLGSSFIRYFLETNQDTHIINLDKLTYAASTKNLANLPPQRHTLIRGDICNELLLKDIFEARKIEGIINFAAESPVKNSLIPPYQYVKTNIEGTFMLLEQARKIWMDAPRQYKEEYKEARFMQISTADVYGDIGEGGLSKEEDGFAPQTPFSASKAGADLMTAAYSITYGLNTVVLNAGGCFGPFQYDDKLIPTVVKMALSGQEIPVYGNGQNKRDWMYSQDCAKAIALAFLQGKSGERYNACAGNEFSILDMVKKVCAVLDAVIPDKTGKPYAENIVFKEDPSGAFECKRYAADNAKLKYQLNWAPPSNFETKLKDTVLFYIDKYKTI